jgi:hypothetical protein
VNLQWSAITDTLQNAYGRDYRGHLYKFEFFKNLTNYFQSNEQVDVLEVGSYEGVSLITIAYILREMRKLGRIVSVDPYFPDGYLETPPECGTLHKASTPQTMAAALRLYDSFGLKVELLRECSDVALTTLLHKRDKFDLIFVDGNHEQLNPLIDAALAVLLLRENGILCLDDVEWPDVRPIANLCSKHMHTLFVSKTQMAFAKRNPHGPSATTKGG